MFLACQQINVWCCKELLSKKAKDIQLLLGAVSVIFFAFPVGQSEWSGSCQCCLMWDALFNKVHTHLCPSLWV